ncbi:MAG: tetratricopeptide repeat protein [Ruminococcaceae bacterium]|nr:tetratricopeptide repeat protein [Oscillospiraceae bacterium]
MMRFDLKPLMLKFNEYIVDAGSRTDVIGARKEFDELIKKVFSPFDYSKASKEQLSERKMQHDSFIMICDALRASEDENTYIIESLALTGRGNIHQLLGNDEQAARDFRHSADVAAGFAGGKEVRIAGLLKLAPLYSKMQKPDSCISCYSEALKIASGMQDNESQTRVMAILADRGSAYCRVRKLQEACDDFNRAIEIYNDLGTANAKTQKILLKCLANRSGVLVNMQRFEDARQDGLKAVEIEGEMISSSTPVVLTNLAAACNCLGNYEEAEKYYTRVIMIKKVSGAIRTPAGRIDLATILMGRGEVLIKNGKYSDSRTDLAEAAALFTDLLEKHEAVVKPRLIRTLKLKAQAESELGDETAAEKDLSLCENLTGKALD